MSDPWRPDIATLRWCFGHADERQVAEAVRADVLGRMADHNPPFAIDEESPVFWQVVGESAVEAVLYDLLRRAQEA